MLMNEYRPYSPLVVGNEYQIIGVIRNVADGYTYWCYVEFADSEHKTLSEYIMKMDIVGMAQTIGGLQPYLTKLNYAVNEKKCVVGFIAKTTYDRYCLISLENMTANDRRMVTKIVERYMFFNETALYSDVSLVELKWLLSEIELREIAEIEPKIQPEILGIIRRGKLGYTLKTDVQFATIQDKASLFGNDLCKRFLKKGRYVKNVVELYSMVEQIACHKYIPKVISQMQVGVLIKDSMGYNLLYITDDIPEFEELQKLIPEYAERYSLDAVLSVVPPSVMEQREKVHEKIIIAFEKYTKAGTEQHFEEYKGLLEALKGILGA